MNIDSELCKIEETFSYMESLAEPDNVNRPDSNVSFSSWTLSPISDEPCDIQFTQQGDTMTTEEPAKVNPKLPPLQQMSQPSYQLMSPDYPHLNQRQQISYPHEHYHPNAVYHHSVNIHNYNVGPPAWQCEPPMTYSVYNINMPKTEFIVDQHDPLASFNGSETEFARCSTPEYLMALNSLHQSDSPPPLQTTGKVLQDCSYAPTATDQPAPAPKHVELTKQQDSGYSSDLDASPVIDYQDNHLKMTKDTQMRKKPTSTSTPVVYPVLRLANMMNRDNGSLVPRRLLTQPVMSMPGFVPKMYATNHPNYLASTGLNQTANQASFRQIQSQEISSSVFRRQNSVKFTSMADYQAAKKAAAQEKRKVEEIISNKENTNSNPQKQSELNDTECQPVKRRRHNEPLNYMALQVMNSWYEQNLSNPYPTKAQKELLAEQGGINVSQVKSWFANKRNRSNNTRPKKQRKVMEDQLMNICHQLAQDARKPNKDNAYYIQQLSSIMDSAKPNISP